MEFTSVLHISVTNSKSLNPLMVSMIVVRWEVSTWTFLGSHWGRRLWSLQRHWQISTGYGGDSANNVGDLYGISCGTSMDNRWFILIYKWISCELIGGKHPMISRVSKFQPSKVSMLWQHCHTQLPWLGMVYGIGFTTLGLHPPKEIEHVGKTLGQHGETSQKPVRNIWGHFWTHFSSFFWRLLYTGSTNWGWTWTKIDVILYDIICTYIYIYCYILHIWNY